VHYATVEVVETPVQTTGGSLTVPLVAQQVSANGFSGVPLPQWSKISNASEARQMRRLQIVLLMLLTSTLSGCATMRLMNEMKEESDTNLAAWNQARQELKEQCVKAPDICESRLVLRAPMRGYVYDDDWQYEALPPYKTIIDTHERILRQARNYSLRIPEEMMFALARGLTKRLEDGEITPEVFKTAFSQGWNAGVKEILNDYSVLLQNAKNADDETMKAITQTLTVVAVVAGAVLIAAAASQPSYTVVQSTPAVNSTRSSFYCTAYSSVQMYCY